MIHEGVVENPQPMHFGGQQVTSFLLTGSVANEIY